MQGELPHGVTDVTVVVLAWEDHERTRACVQSIGADTPVVVVDNGSSAPHEAGLAEIARTAPNVVLVRSDENLGFARGMNLGLREVATRYVILSNNDLVVEPDTIPRLIRALADEGTGAAFPRVLDAQGIEATAAGHFLTMTRALAHAVGIDAVVSSLNLVATPENSDWLTGPFVAIETAFLRELGGVSERSFFYAEDYRLCRSVRSGGRRIALVEDARVIHEDDASAKQVWDSAQIARRQTVELVRAAREPYGRFAAAILAAAYAWGCQWRAWLAPNEMRRAIAAGAWEGGRI